MSLELNQVNSGSSDQIKDRNAKALNIHIDIFWLSILIVFFQKIQTKNVEPPQIKNLINVTKALGKKIPKECIPNTPEKKVNPSIIKHFSASLRSGFIVLVMIFWLSNWHILETY
jgi:hypothetical protein